MKQAICLFCVIALMTGCRDQIPIDPPPVTPVQVRIILEKLVFSPNEKINIKIENRDIEPVFLEGCSVFYISAKNDTGWNPPSPFLVCVWEGIARQLDPGDIYKEKQQISNPGVYKIAAPVYFGCESDKPISQAGCGRSELIWSLPLTIVENL
ncbi:hypothetical protein JW935_11070 [candidate division KSB1 bacterium]|nr:hypothetical protein [candidate division KSB1 bacterium]